MTIYHHNHKDRVVLELEENEFTLISFLLEKSSQKHKHIIKKSLSAQMFDTIKEFEGYE